MDGFGDIIRKLREEKELPLRVVSAYIDIDQAILSKIETGKKNASREQVVKLAEYFKTDENNLLVAWLAGKLVYEVGDEEVALQAMKVAEEAILYKNGKVLTLQEIKKNVKKIAMLDNRVLQIWLFGSYARGEADYKSDIDLLVFVAEKSKFSYFDLAGIQHNLEQISGKKVDLGFYGSMKEGPWERAKKDLKLLYEK